MFCQPGQAKHCRHKEPLKNLVPLQPEHGCDKISESGSHVAGDSAAAAESIDDRGTWRVCTSCQVISPHLQGANAAFKALCVCVCVRARKSSYGGLRPRPGSAQGKYQIRQAIAMLLHAHIVSRVGRRLPQDTLCSGLLDCEMTSICRVRSCFIKTLRDMHGLITAIMQAGSHHLPRLMTLPFLSMAAHS